MIKLIKRLFWISQLILLVYFCLWTIKLPYSLFQKPLQELGKKKQIHIQFQHLEVSMTQFNIQNLTISLASLLNLKVERLECHWDWVDLIQKFQMKTSFQATNLEAKASSSFLFGFNSIHIQKTFINYNLNRSGYAQLENSIGKREEEASWLEKTGEIFNINSMKSNEIQNISFNFKNNALEWSITEFAAQNLDFQAKGHALILPDKTIDGDIEMNYKPTWPHGDEATASWMTLLAKLGGPINAPSVIVRGHYALESQPELAEVMNF